MALALVPTTSKPCRTSLLVTRNVTGWLTGSSIGSGPNENMLAITDTILELLDKPRTLIRHVEDRPGHDRRYAVDSTKLSRMTGWRPKVEFADGIRQTVEWFRKNESWWRPIKEGEFRSYYERMYGQRRVLKEVRA